MIWKIIFGLWLTGAVVADLSTYKIPNRLCLCMAVNGVAMQLYLHGAKGMIDAGIGMGIPFAVLFVLFVARVLGAGDIKLLSAAGTFVGTGIGPVLLYTCICAGVTAVLKLIWVVCSNRKKECTEWGKQSGTAGLWERLAGVKTATRMHMSVPIACGCVIYMIAV